LDERLLTRSGQDLEWPEGDVALDGGVAKLATDQTLSVEDGVSGVSSSLVLGCVTNEALLLSESDV